jgi:hypothetical protein
MKKPFLSVILCFLMLSCFAQNNASVTLIDFVKIKNGLTKEAMFYYENNWKMHRDTMLAKGFIKSYKLMVSTSDTTKFDLMLTTEYADSTQFKESEPRWSLVIKTNRPNGTALLNDKKPNDFREFVYSYEFLTPFTSGEQKDKKRKKRK